MRSITTIDAIDRGQGDWFSGVYRDGCDLAPRCLDCSLPACRYEMPAKAAGAEMQRRQVEMLARSGLHADDIAERLSIARRTVYRHLKASGLTKTYHRGGAA